MGDEPCTEAAQLREIADRILKHTIDSDWTPAHALEVDGAMRYLNSEWIAARRSFAMNPEWFTKHLHGAT